MITIEDIIESKKFNSLTKYPSILTYHVMDEKAHCLKEELSQEVMPLSSCPLYASEKIDGENIRILILNGDYVIGGRKDWLYAKGDRAVSQGIKEKMKFLKGIADDLINQIPCKSFNPFKKEKFNPFEKDILYCIYGEVYGSSIQKSSKHYTTQKNVYGFRVFDSWKMDVTQFEDLAETMNETQCSNWRETNQQPWMTVGQLNFYCGMTGLEMVPYLEDVDFSLLGTSFESAYDFISSHQHTLAQLDDNEKKSDKPEGIVLRNYSRSFITKLRFEDYEQTFKKIRGK